MNKTNFIRSAIATALIVMTSPVVGQDVYVYPANGQTDEQLADDRFECHRWAVEESGFDPSLIADLDPPRTVRVPVPKNKAEGAVKKGAIAGAVVGGVIGSHDGDAVEGAVIGAVVGSMAGTAIEAQGDAMARKKAREDAKARADEISKSKTELALRKSNYRRALSACLEGNGYTVR